jgi:hypothetical protein
MATRPRAKRAATTSSAQRPPAATLKTTTTFMLRTCDAQLRSYNEFQWPESGPVECPDWNPEPICGYGLHGLLHGKGDYGLVSFASDAKWLVVAVDADVVVNIDGQKVKVPRGEVVFVGSGSEAVEKLLEVCPEADRSQLPFTQASASGWRGQASASGTRGQASASGDYGQASASGYQGQASASGDYGQASANRGRARAGQLGILILFRRDEEADRDRVVVGYVGENGIEADTWYKLDGDRIVPAPDNYDFQAFDATDTAKDARELKLELGGVAEVAS